MTTDERAIAALHSAGHELTRLRARVERLEAACRKLIVCAEMVADCDAGEDDEQPASKSARAAIKAAREALEP